MMKGIVLQRSYRQQGGVVNADLGTSLVIIQSCNRIRQPMKGMVWVIILTVSRVLEVSWNVMAYAQKPDFVFRRNELVNLIRRGCQFSRLLAAQVCASAIVMLDTPCSEVVWRILATHCISQFPLRFPSPASPCAITLRLESTSTCKKC